MLNWGHPGWPCRRMILTVRTDQLTLQTTNETATSPLLPARWWQQDQNSRALLVVCIHYVKGAGDAGEKQPRGAVSASVCRVDRIARLSRDWANTIKGWSEQKAKYSINIQKVGKWLKMRKHSARNGMVGVHFLLYDVRGCFIGCVTRRSERLTYMPLAERKQPVEPRRLLLPTDKIEHFKFSYFLIYISYAITAQHSDRDRTWLITLMGASGISGATSATTSTPVPRLCVIIWKQRHTSTTVQIAQKYSHANDTCVDTCQPMALLVSMLLLTWFSYCWSLCRDKQVSLHCRCSLLLLLSAAV